MLASIEEFLKILKSAHLQYCIIGGFAVLLHGGRASTIDLDFYILAKDIDLLKSILKSHRIKMEKKGDFQLIAKFRSVKIDILIAAESIGESVIQRAQIKTLGKSKVSVATPEDLIVLKTIAGRSLDLRDIEELREIFQDHLDEQYIQSQLQKML